MPVRSAGVRVPPALVEELRALAQSLESLDIAAYDAFGRDPLQPIIGLGPADAPVCFMGRDPGREEVRLGLPFVGEAGQLLRAGLHAHLHPHVPYSFEAGLQAGEAMFWLNTVPYKPAGNKAWSVGVQERFRPCMTRLLARWRGDDVITLGNEAFFWFGLGQSTAIREQLKSFWELGEPRYEQSVEVIAQLGRGARKLRIHPLPHPSRANALWCRRFPALLERRLSRVL